MIDEQDIWNQPIKEPIQAIIQKQIKKPLVICINQETQNKREVKKIMEENKEVNSIFFSCLEEGEEYISNLCSKHYLIMPVQPNTTLKNNVWFVDFYVLKGQWEKSLGQILESRKRVVNRETYTTPSHITLQQQKSWNKIIHFQLIQEGIFSRHHKMCEKLHLLAFPVCNRNEVLEYLQTLETWLSGMDSLKQCLEYYPTSYSTFDILNYHILHPYLRQFINKFLCSTDRVQMLKYIHILYSDLNRAISQQASDFVGEVFLHCCLGQKEIAQLQAINQPIFIMTNSFLISENKQKIKYYNNTVLRVKIRGKVLMKCFCVYNGFVFVKVGAVLRIEKVYFTNAILNIDCEIYCQKHQYQQIKKIHQYQQTLQKKIRNQTDFLHFKHQCIPNIPKANLLNLNTCYKAAQYFAAFDEQKALNCLNQCGKIQSYYLVTKNLSAIRNCQACTFAYFQDYQKSQKLLEEGQKVKHSGQIRKMNNLAFIYLKKKQIEKAENIYDQIKEILTEQNIEEYVTIQNNIATIHVEKKEWEIAREVFQKCKKLLENAREQQSKLYNQIAINLAMIDFYQKKFDVALQTLQKIIKIQEKTQGKSTAYIQTKMKIARIFEEQKQTFKAIRMFNQASHRARTVYGRDHSISAQIAHKIGDLEDGQNSLNYLYEALQIYEKLPQKRWKQRIDRLTEVIIQREKKS